MKKVIAFGEALIDMLSTTVTDESNQTHEAFIKFPGGAPANVAAAVGKLGAPSYFAGKVGQDMFGDFLIETLQACNVKTDYMLQTSEAKTALAFVSLDGEGERSFEFYRDASADLLFTAEDFQDAWFEEPGLFHFCSNTLTQSQIRDVTIAGIRKAREAGFLISFDVNLRHNLWPKTEDVNPIRHFKHVWHVVADQHHRQAFITYIFDQIQYASGLFNPKRSGGFIHDDHVFCKRRRTGHRDPLALTTREGFNRLVDVLDGQQA
jgi:sugar/nucleoside kinase (ribokinase family)